MADAWFCPACQRYHAPHVETCPGGGARVEEPSLPQFPAPLVLCGCNRDEPCLSVDCPYATRVTCAYQVPSEFTQ